LLKFAEEQKIVKVADATAELIDKYPNTMKGLFERINCELKESQKVGSGINTIKNILKIDYGNSWEAHQVTLVLELPNIIKAYFKDDKNKSTNHVNSIIDVCKWVTKKAVDLRCLISSEKLIIDKKEILFLKDLQNHLTNTDLSKNTIRDTRIVNDDLGKALSIPASDLTIHDLAKGEVLKAYYEHSGLAEITCKNRLSVLGFLVKTVLEMLYTGNGSADKLGRSRFQEISHDHIIGLLEEHLPNEKSEFNKTAGRLQVFKRYNTKDKLTSTDLFDVFQKPFKDFCKEVKQLKESPKVDKIIARKVIRLIVSQNLLTARNLPDYLKILNRNLTPEFKNAVDKLVNVIEELELTKSTLETYQKILRHFLYWCTDCEIKFVEMDNKTIEDFVTTKTNIKKKERDNYKWSTMHILELLEERKIIKTSIKYQDKSRTRLRFEDWPSDVKKAYMKYVKERGRKLSPVSEENYIDGIGHFLGELKKKRVNIYDMSLSKIFSEKNIKYYHDLLEERNGRTETLATRLNNIKRIAEAGGVKNVRKVVDDLIYKGEDFEKSSKRLKDTSLSRAELVKLVSYLETRFQKSKAGGNEERAAVALRDLITIYILIFCCWRSSNIHGLKINKNVYKTDEVWRFNFDPKEQKRAPKFQKMAIELKGGIPNILQGLLDEYDEVYRPILLRGRIDDHLLVTDVRTSPIRGQNNTRGYFVSGTLKNRVYTLTQDAIGKKINPHAFRRAISELFLKEFPEYRANVDDLLWHFDKGGAKSTKYYVDPSIGLERSMERIHNWICDVIDRKSQKGRLTDLDEKLIINDQRDEIKRLHNDKVQLNLEIEELKRKYGDKIISENSINKESEEVKA
jgi:integrase